MRTSRPLTFLATIALLLTTTATVAQRAPIPHEFKPYSLDSGAVTHLDERAESVVFEQIVDGGNVDWTRIVFGETVLQGESYLRLTSLYDGAVQHLTTTELEQWSQTSAFFNGSQIRVELVAAPGTWKNRVSIDQVMVSTPVGPISESQCGSNDDRVPSSFPERGRLVNIGCTASIITESSCFLTAGHCTTFAFNTMEFNVPESLANGSIQHPGPEDQFPIDQRLSPWANGGVGNDFATFTVFPSSETGLRPYEAYGVKLDLADSIPPIGGDITIVGYGVDGGARNQTQQVHNGPRVNEGAPDALEYQADTEGGNSGSAVVRSDTGEVIGVHTHAGCNLDNGQGNQGTSILKASLQDAIAACPAGGATAFNLSAPSPGLPGTENTWEVEGATPGHRIPRLRQGQRHDRRPRMFRRQRRARERQAGRKHRRRR